MTYRPHNISWPARRLLMAEADNANAQAPPTLADCRDSVLGGYRPYDGFPVHFVLEELNWLLTQYDPQTLAADLISKRDWAARASGSQEDPGEPPLSIQVDEDLARRIEAIAENNGLTADGYANQLLEYGLTWELGRQAREAGDP